MPEHIYDMEKDLKIARGLEKMLTIEGCLAIIEKAKKIIPISAYITIKMGDDGEDYLLVIVNHKEDIELVPKEFEGLEVKTRVRAKKSFFKKTRR